MNRFLTLTKVLLKNNSSGTIKKGKIPKKYILLIFIGLCFLPIMISISYSLGVAYDILVKIQQQGSILGLGISAVCVIIFVFGIFLVINTFYFSKDVENLLPLPLRPAEILASKFIVVLIYEYAPEIVVLLPFIIMYGIKSSGGILYCIYGLVIFMTLPIIPIVLDSFLAIFIMRFTNIGSHKERFKTIGGLFALFIGIGFNIISQRFANNNMSNEKIMELFKQGNNSFLDTVTKVFPGANLAAKAMINNDSVKGIMFLVAFLLVNIALIGIFLILGEGLYFKGVVGLSEAPSKRKNLSSEEIDKSLIQNSSIKAYTIKEFKLIFRTSVYFMNCIIMNFIWPICLIPLLMQKDSMSSIKKFGPTLGNGSTAGIALSVAFGIIMFISMSNPTASTSISREGENIFVCKYLPMSYKKQIIAKALSGILLTLTGLIVLIIMAIVVINPPVIIVILTIVIGILGLIFSALTGIFIDLSFPKLHWENEQKAVKNNLNVLFNMLIGAIIGGLSVYLVIKFKLTMWSAFVAFTTAFLTLDIILYYMLSTIGVKLYKEIGE